MSDLADEVLGRVPGATADLDYGVVTQVSPLLVRVGTASTALPAEALAGYTPRVNDYVAVLQRGADRLVLSASGAPVPPWGASWGEVAYAQKVANELNFTTVADITGLSVTYTQVAGRKYLTVARVRTEQSAAAGFQTLLLTDAANSQIDADAVSVAASATTTRSILHREVAATSASVTRKLRLTVAGGDVDVIAAGVQPSFIQVLDVGPS